MIRVIRGSSSSILRERLRKKTRGDQEVPATTVDLQYDASLLLQLFVLGFVGTSYTHLPTDFGEEPLFESRERVRQTDRLEACPACLIKFAAKLFRRGHSDGERLGRDLRQARVPTK